MNSHSSRRCRIKVGTLRFAHPTAPRSHTPNAPPRSTRIPSRRHPHRPAVAEGRIAPAAAAGGAEDQAVARLHRHAGRLEELLFSAVAAHQNSFVDGAGPAAVEPPRRILGAL